eukprot:scaffold4082_cov62-Phaeocystis_antarctica.AAC.4
MKSQSSSREEAAAASASASASTAAEEEEGKALPVPVSFSGAANQQPGGAGSNVRRHHLLRERSTARRSIHARCTVAVLDLHRRHATRCAIGRASGHASGSPHRHLLEAAQQCVGRQPLGRVDLHCDTPLLARGVHAALAVVVEKQLLGLRSEGHAGRLEVRRLVVRALRVPNLHKVGRALHAIHALRAGRVKPARVQDGARALLGRRERGERELETAAREVARLA